MQNTCNVESHTQWATWFMHMPTHTRTKKACMVHHTYFKIWSAFVLDQWVEQNSSDMNALVDDYKLSHTHTRTQTHAHTLHTFAHTHLSHVSSYNTGSEMQNFLTDTQVGKCLNSWRSWQRGGGDGGVNGGAGWGNIQLMAGTSILFLSSPNVLWIPTPLSK